MKLGKPLNETEAVSYLDQILAIQTPMSSLANQPEPSLLAPLDLFHYCAKASLAVINSQ